jgi:hypothetical protein
MEKKSPHNICRLVSRKEVKYSQVEQVDGREMLEKDAKAQNGFVRLKPGANGELLWARHFTFGSHKMGQTS